MFYLLHAGSSLQVMTGEGQIYSTLVLPAGVTLSTTRPARFAVLGRRVIIVNAPSQTLWLDPLDFSLHRLALGNLTAPTTAPAAPVAAIGASTGLTGTYKTRYTFIHKSGGALMNEGLPSAESNAIVLANKSLGVSGIAISTNPDVTGRRLYRTVAGGSVYLFWHDIDDNTTTTYDAADADASLGDAIPDLGFAAAGTDNGTRFTLITEWRSRLWARADTVGLVDHIYYSEIDTPWQWLSANDLPAPSLGEDSIGITGFIRRRDELGVGKRNRILRVVTTDDLNFEIIGVTEQLGLLSSDSIQVIRDEGYFHGTDGVYKFGAEGITPLSRDKVDPWFQTDEHFARDRFTGSVSGYNALNDTYDLHLSAVGSTTLDRWVSYGIGSQKWNGPHKTAAFTPTMRAMFKDAGSAYLPVMGGSDGFVYLLNQATPSDYAGGAPTVAIGIVIDWITNYLTGQLQPDITHVFGQPTFHMKPQGAGAGNVTITPRVGDLQTLDGTTQLLSLVKARQRLNIWGSGRLLRLEFTHSTAGEDVELYLWEQPVNAVGRR